MSRFGPYVCSRKVLDVALSGLPAFGEPPLKAIEVHARVNLWAPTTFKHALAQLEKLGEAVSVFGTDGARHYTKAKTP